MIQAMASTLRVTVRIIAAIALISGVTPRRIDAKTYIGSVFWPGPATNWAMMKSSQLKVNESSAPARTAGSSWGNVTWRNVRQGVAYRSAN